MYCRLALLQCALTPPRLLWYAVFRLHRVATLAINAFGCGVRLGHGGVFSELAFSINFFFHSRNQVSVLFRCDPFLVEQVFPEAVNTVTLTPELVHFFRNVGGGIVDGMPFHAHQLGLDQSGAFAAVGAFDGFVGCVINLAGIGAVNDYAGHAVANGAIGEVFYRDLILRWSGISPEIALDDQNQAELAHRGKIDSFIADAGGLPAIADPGEAGKFPTLQARTQRDASHYGK